MSKQYLVIISDQYEDELGGYYNTAEEAIAEANRYRQSFGNRKVDVIVAKIIDGWRSK